MGIYGALSTAVSGLRAQAFSLENISGNIANSQTTGFKRIDTDFLDLIPDAPQKRQVAGSVIAQSRSTNNLQGDIRSAGTDTFMAINGSGFFVVEPRTGQSDGAATFSGANYYTRRGDLELDKNGVLVNGAGYYLKGLPIDPATQHLRLGAAGAATVEPVPAGLPDHPHQLPAQPAAAAADGAVCFVRNVRQRAAQRHRFREHPPNQAATVAGTSAMASGDAIGTVLSTGDLIEITVGGRRASFNVVTSGGCQPRRSTRARRRPSAPSLPTQRPVPQRDLRARRRRAHHRDGQYRGDDVEIVANSTSGTSGTGLGLGLGTYEATVSDAAAQQPRRFRFAQDADAFIAQSISAAPSPSMPRTGAGQRADALGQGELDRRRRRRALEPVLLTDASATGPAGRLSRVGGDSRSAPTVRPTRRSSTPS